jgi:hypothetical protein
LVINCSLIELQLAIFGPDERVEQTVAIEVSQDDGSGTNTEDVRRILAALNERELARCPSFVKKEATGMRHDGVWPTIPVNVTKGWF